MEIDSKTMKDLKEKIILEAGVVFRMGSEKSMEEIIEEAADYVITKHKMEKEFDSRLELIETKVESLIKEKLNL